MDNCFLTYKIVSPWRIEMRTNTKVLRTVPVILENKCKPPATTMLVTVLLIQITWPHFTFFYSYFTPSLPWPLLTPSLSSSTLFQKSLYIHYFYLYINILYFYISLYIFYFYLFFILCFIFLHTIHCYLTLHISLLLLPLKPKCPNSGRMPLF